MLLLNANSLLIVFLFIVWYNFCEEGGDFIVGSFIGYFFYALSFKVMVWIILLDLALLLALLYFRNYKNHHYGGKFNDHFPDAH